LQNRLELEEDEELNYVSLGKYGKEKNNPFAELRKQKEKNKEDVSDEPKVAVIYAYGAIQSGKGDSETIGSESVSGAIREAREDSTVKALVLRVNSPGGSALASDVIWREMVLANEQMPVIVSMGDVAASGGYYIACASDKIYASPNTITGSIGVFGIIPNMKDFWNNKLGITFDGVYTNAHTGYANGTRALDDYEFSVIQQSVEDIYDDFIGKVADGRGLTKEEVDAIGQGRVWSGIDAKEIGLIDEFGGLDEAIADAASMAELGEDYEVRTYPEEESKFSFLLDMQTRAKTWFAKEYMGEFYGQYKTIENIKNFEGTQARLPYNFVIY